MFNIAGNRQDMCRRHAREYLTGNEETTPYRRLITVDIVLYHILRVHNARNTFGLRHGDARLQCARGIHSCYVYGRVPGA